MLRRSLFMAMCPALILAACDKPSATAIDNPASKAATIPCALARSTEFKAECTVERSTSDDGILLTIHHPDGGFRRLQVATDGRGVVTADGSDPAIVKIVDHGMIEVIVGEDRYRLPATVKGQAVPAQ